MSPPARSRLWWLERAKKLSRKGGETTSKWGISALNVRSCWRGNVVKTHLWVEEGSEQQTYLTESMMNAVNSHTDKVFQNLPSEPIAQWTFISSDPVSFILFANLLGWFMCRHNELWWMKYYFSFDVEEASSCRT